MESLLLLAGRLAGGVGFVAVVVAVGLRLAGVATVARFDAITLLHAGTAAMVVGCLAHLVAIADRLPPRR